MSALTHAWSGLSPQQLGKYAEYFTKLQFTLYGLDVYSAEVDDKGIDFIIRRSSSCYYDVQVKSCRGLNYIFFPKSKFDLRDNMLAAIVLFSELEVPELYLVPSSVWLTPNTLFVSKDYVGLKSQPEWGLNLSQRNLPLLEPYRFIEIAHRL